MMEFLGLGVMIGSSLDGIDIALCKFDFDDSNELAQWELVSYEEFPLADSIRHAVKQHQVLSTQAIADLELEIADAVVAAVKQLELPRTVSYLALHGITIKHYPSKKISIQLGDAQRIADKTGIQVISDFRQADMEAGGEGTPMVPIAEQLLFSEYDYFLNLGGIANVSDHTVSSIIAYDVCPFNQVFNHFSKRLGKPYDDQGIFASRGRCHQELIDRLLSLPYFALDAPKSIDNNWISDEVIPLIESFELKAEDVLASFVKLTSQLISDACKHSKQAGQMMVTGGGVFNQFFINQLEKDLIRYQIRLHIPEANISNGKEAILMALAGVLHIKEIPNFIPSVTGAHKAVVGGQIYHEKK